MKKIKDNIGNIIIESLTKEQMACLLDVLFSSIDMTRYVDMFKKADPDMAETVSKILKMGDKEPDKPEHGRLASDHRIVEQWNSLWEKWGGVILEVGDEEGKYTVQEEHWEPPYFDGSALADDLDRIGEEMLSLIDEVYDLLEEPDLFLDALDEINEAIFTYPEEMNVEDGDGCVLGVNATRCVLKWLWLSSKKEPNPGQSFFDKVFKIEDCYSLVGINKDECVDFFVKLPDEAGREIYQCFKSGNCQCNLDSVHSSWHKINHFYEERFDPARYLETCRKHLAENWRYGRPLIDEAVNQGDYTGAESWLEKTFFTYLNLKEDKRWYPETSLLPKGYAYLPDNKLEDISNLLETWSIVSKKLGHPKRSAASHLQSVIFRNTEDWEAVIGEYKRLQDTEVKEVIDLLFVQWQNEMAWKSVGNIMNRQGLADTWVHWLIEAEVDITGKRDWFIEKLRVWLVDLKENTHIFIKQWPWLARLTKDMPGGKVIDKEYPTFFKIVLPSSDFGESLLVKERCVGLEKLEAGSCLPLVMDVWKSSLHHIIPDPENAHKSDYTLHAEWMKALYELNQKEYHTLLAQWQVQHKRRRNLWQDMKSHHLPI